MHLGQKIFEGCLGVWASETGAVADLIKLGMQQARMQFPGEVATEVTMQSSVS